MKASLCGNGEKGLINSEPCPENPGLRTPAAIEEKILCLRRNYHYLTDLAHSLISLICRLRHAAQTMIPGALLQSQCRSATHLLFYRHNLAGRYV